MSRASNDNAPAAGIAPASPLTHTVPAVDAPAHEVIAGRADAGVVLVCDHAGNAFPPVYGTLGLPAAEIGRHIAYDIGAAEVTRELAGRLRAPAVLTRYSRLLIDPNRGLDDPTLIMRISDGAVVPGNRHLDEAERAARIERYYRPYHDAIRSTLDTCIAAGRPPVLVAVHSFTEAWKGVPRPWHVGVLWDEADARLARLMLAAFGADGDLVVGDNEPYRGHLRGDTMWQHGIERGLPHVLIEIRQDLVRDAVGRGAWARRIADILLALPEEFRPTA